ncbi:MGDG synthase family glycosyltransferase [Paenibacillus caui]|uniref:MGDG synthase family glycosyltransferase n=1 Tax=Paenibacillus caui TaxID=2873927 RepID=UPI001CA833EC|nr:glycosyltransferase [Paenibacillus caui]
MGKKRVLILSEGFGFGHTKAAYGLAAGLRQKFPGVQAKVMELGTFLNPSIGPLILAAYRKTVSTSPLLLGIFYRSNYHKPINRLTRLALHKLFYARALRVVTQLKPDLIVCTHPIPGAVMARLKAEHEIDVPVCTLITDYDAHGAWLSAEIDRFLVSTPEVKQLLTESGISPARVKVTGIPVHPKFWSVSDKSNIRKELGLEDMPTVLVMGGGFGLLFEEEMMEGLAAWRDRVQLLICTGTNVKLAEKLRRHPAFNHSYIRILGMTDQVDKLMDACDLLITKPGGITCTEGLAKGIPMLFTGCIPGQEQRNCEYFVKAGYGSVLADRETLDQWFIRLTSNRPFSQRENSDPASDIKTPVRYDPEKCVMTIAEMLYAPDDLLIEESAVYL